MGYYINVDLDALQSAKNALNEYENKRKKIVNEMKSVVNQTSKPWYAEDREAFMVQWNGMSASDGIFTITGESISNYNKLLQSAYDLYKKAQSDCVDQATKI